jgi:hypothetical protein
LGVPTKVFIACGFRFRQKIRKLRASITDLSEESTRDLEEVEKRGLSGGIKLVRTLREELREIEFALNETKSAEALCRAKIKVLQSKLGAKKQQPDAALEGDAKVVGNIVASDSVQSPTSELVTPVGSSKGAATTSKPPNGHSQQQSTPFVIETESKWGEASGESNSSNVIALQYVCLLENVGIESSRIVRLSLIFLLTFSSLRKPSSHGYFTVDLWEILLRIIGLRSSSRSPAGSQNSVSNVMIV